MAIDSQSSYPDILDEAWRKHLAPRERHAPTVISTFAGAGGSSLGYSMAGFRELLAVEWDDRAVATFKLNFPDVPVYHGDIAQLSIEEALLMTGLCTGDLDVLDGSPPCQGFSVAGSRQLGDERNQLFREFVRLLDGLRPRAFVMENVSGMVKGKMKLIFADIMQELRDSDYRVSCRKMNAMYFNVPQSRERMIFIGVREDLGIAPSHPPAQNYPISAGVALRGVINDEEERQMLLAAGDRYKGYREWHLMQPGQKRTQAVGGNIGFSCIKIDPRKPCRTIPKNDMNISCHGLMHWRERRRFTTAEYARLSSFPAQFQFAGSWKDAVGQMGNSVPPLFMRAIANHVRSEILVHS